MPNNRHTHTLSTEQMNDTRSQSMAGIYERVGKIQFIIIVAFVRCRVSVFAVIDNSAFEFIDVEIERDPNYRIIVFI